MYFFCTTVRKISNFDPTGLAPTSNLFSINILSLTGLPQRGKIAVELKITPRFNKVPWGRNIFNVFGGNAKFLPDSKVFFSILQVNQPHLPKAYFT